MRIRFLLRVALAALALAQAEAAFGHATVLSSEPPDGAVLAAPPRAVVIHFDEPVSLISARVLDGGGHELNQPGLAAAQDGDLRIALPAGLADGMYVASYRVVSLDSHPVGGSIVFTVGALSSGARPSTVTPGADDNGWREAFVAALAVLYAGALGSAGAVMFLLFVRPPQPAIASCRRIAAVFSLVAILAAVLVAGIEGGFLLDAPAAALLSVEAWRTGLLSTLGQSALTAIVGGVLVGVAQRGRPSAAKDVVAALGAVVILVSFVLTGHVATAPPRLLTMPLLFIHTATVAFWIGALLPLVLTLRRMGKDAAPTVRRFSRIALVAVPVLVVAGASIAALELGSVSALFASRYGAVLLLKLALFAALLLLAAMNKLRLTPRLAAGEPRAARALTLSIAAEMVLVTAILVVTAILGTTPPPRVGLLSSGHAPAAMEEAHQLPAKPAGPTLMVHASGKMVLLRFGSHAAGANTLDIELSDLESGMPIVVREVSVAAANIAAGVEPIARKAALAGEGRWRVDGLVLVPAGTWSVRVDALISDFEQATFETKVELH